MKSSRDLARLLFAFGFTLVVVQGAYGTLFFEDAFVYPTSNLAGNGAWTGANANIQVTSTSLAYPGLFDPGPGNAVTVTSGAASGTTSKANFIDTPITSGSVYYSFLAQCTALPSANNYLTSLNAAGGGPSGSADPLSVYVGIQSTGSSFFKIGVRHTGIGTGATYATSPTFTVGSTHFFVVEYTFGSGGTVNLFVDPAPGEGSIQPAADVTVTGGGTDAANLQVVGFKAQTAATAGNWIFDTVRIGDTWAAVTIPEPSVGMLLGFGVLSLAVWRRVR